MYAKLCVYAFVLCLVDGGNGKGSSLIKLSRNIAYHSELVTVMCHRSAGVLLSVTIDAFNATHLEGILYCNIYPVNTTATGVFSGNNFTGCPFVQPESTIASVSLVATPSMELNYSCTSTIYDTTHKTEYTQSSEFASLIVLVRPARPIFVRSPLVFNEKDNGTVVCESSNGKPAAFLRLTVRRPNGKEISTTGVNSALLMLPVPLTDWHNATAVCTVTNHNFSRNTVSSGITINHIFRTADRAFVYVNSSNATVDCSAYISSYPDPQYSWVLPRNISADYRSFVREPFLTVLQGDSGSFYCTATNNVTQSSVTVVFTAYGQRQWSSDWPLIGFCVVNLVVVVIYIIVVILRKRGYFSTRRNQVCSKLQTLLKRDNALYNDDEIPMTENPVYSGLPTMVTDIVEDVGPNGDQYRMRSEGTSDGDNKKYSGDDLAEQDRQNPAHIYEEIGTQADRMQSQTPRNEDIKLLSTAVDVT